MIKAFLLGVKDGWNQPYELSSGMTYTEEARNDAYDMGVNLGQLLRAPIKHQRS